MLMDSFLSALVGFFVCAGLCPFLIPLLHRLKFGQNVRSDGPRTHLKKSGTPTMGGIMILLALGCSYIPFALKYPKALPVFLLILAFGVIGFLDDYLKIVKKVSEGLNGKQKFAMQVMVTLLFALFFHRNLGGASGMLLPFTGAPSLGWKLGLGLLSVPAVMFIILGTDNGVNFTDGLDGLCTGVTAIICLFFLVVGLREGSDTAVLSAGVFGSLTGFFIFNRHPARIFMGDTGSLALGAYVSGCALSLNVAFYIPIVGFIYMIEVISVIIQVLYFKATKGKRFFKMAPIHHHFELEGYSERKIFWLFSLVTGLLCLASYLGLYGIG